MANDNNSGQPLGAFDAPVLRAMDATPGTDVGVPRTTFLPSNFGEAMELAKLMAGGTFVPDRLRGKPGDCLAVLMQAVRWGMDPFAVAQKIYFVNNNGIPGYEAQLVAAVVNTSGKLDGSLSVDWQGEGEAMLCIVTGKLKGDPQPKAVQQELRTIKTRNSPLWVQAPRQQLGYYTQRLWARLYAPEVLLGVYTADELDERGPENARDVTPAKDRPKREDFASAKVARVISNRTPEQQADIDAEEEERIARAADAATSIPGDEVVVVDTGEVLPAEPEPEAEGQDGGDPVVAEIDWDSWLAKFEKDLGKLSEAIDCEELWVAKGPRLTNAPEGVRNRAEGLKNARQKKLSPAAAKPAAAARAKPEPRVEEKAEDPAPADQQQEQAQPVNRADAIIADFNKSELLMDLRGKMRGVEEEVDQMDEEDAGRIRRAYRAIEDRLTPKGK